MLQSRHPECKITVFDLRIPVPTTIESERPDPRLIPGVTYERVDITDRPSICELILKIKPTLVIHSAGVIPTVPLLLQKDPKKSDLFEQVNLEGTRNMLDASEAAGVKAIVYTSSADVVKGDSWVDQNGVNENMPYPKSWDNQYAKSKVRRQTVLVSTMPSIYLLLGTSRAISSRPSYRFIFHKCHSTPCCLWTTRPKYRRHVVFGVENATWYPNDDRSRNKPLRFHIR